MSDPLEFSFDINLGVRFGESSHFENESVFVKVQAALVGDRVGLEVGAELESARNWRMFGLGGRDGLAGDTRSLNLRWIAGATFGENQEFTGLDAGSPLPFLGRPHRSHASVSLAVGQDLALRYPSGLESLQTTRGFSQLSLNIGRVRITPWYFKNDASVGEILVFGGDTDRGPTHTSQARLDIKVEDYIVSYALNLELVTPDPIHGRRLKVPGAEFGVYENDPSSPAVFGGYLYHSLRIRSLQASLTLAQGIDSPLAGCVVQRAIHQGPCGRRLGEPRERSVILKILEKLPFVVGPIAEALRDGMKSPLFDWIPGPALPASRAVDKFYSCPTSVGRPYWGIEGEAIPLRGAR
jgi:hypothetical protein